MPAVPLQMTQSLGMARVIRIEGARLLLSMESTQAWSSSAIAYPYNFQVDDQVLVIGQGDDWYVIGVLNGSGKTSLQVPGNLQLVAPNGSIELVASKGISLRSPAVSVIATHLNIAAKRVCERFDNARRVVKQSLEVVAKRLTTKVDGSCRLTAGRIVQRAQGDVKIDGGKIHLG